MELKSRKCTGEKMMTITLPKCGNQRNLIENYDIEKSKLEEEKYIKILNTPHYKRMKEVEKLWQGNQEVIGDKDALKKLLECHPFPRYQGPFNNTMTGKKYEFLPPEDNRYTFETYTTFKHADSQPCQVWEITKQDADQLKLHLTFNTAPVMIDHTLSGPASQVNMSIMYTCQKHKCVIVCPCAVCNNLAPACRKICGSNPCKDCGAQCMDHHIDLPRKYNEEVDSFTIPCYSHTFEPTHIEPKTALTSCSDGHRYAGIPRSCDKCRLDLLDHQIHHHVLHDKCKFCKVELRILDKKLDVKISKNVTEIQQTDDRTCGFCYKVFTRMKTRKLHEKMTHGYYDEKPGRKLRHNIQIHGVEHARDKKRVQCEHCDKSYASKLAFNYHKMQTHALEATKYACDKCILKFRSEASLKRHIANTHESRSLNKCDLCDAKFKRKDKLTRHKQDVHKEANVNHHYFLNSHSPIHLVYPYECRVCGKRFKRKENTKRHKQRICLNVKSVTNSTVKRKP